VTLRELPPKEHFEATWEAVFRPLARVNYTAERDAQVILATLTFEEAYEKVVLAETSLDPWTKKVWSAQADLHARDLLDMQERNPQTHAEIAVFLRALADKMDRYAPGKAVQLTALEKRVCAPFDLAKRQPFSSRAVGVLVDPRHYDDQYLGMESVTRLGLTMSAEEEAAMAQHAVRSIELKKRLRLLTTAEPSRTESPSGSQDSDTHEAPGSGSGS
jgi:hypothetical protein